MKPAPSPRSKHQVLLRIPVNCAERRSVLAFGNGVQILMACLGGIVGVGAIAISFEWLRKGVIRWPLRLLLFAGAAAAVSPDLIVAIISILVSTALCTWLLMQKFK